MPPYKTPISALQTIKVKRMAPRTQTAGQSSQLQINARYTLSVSHPSKSMSERHTLEACATLLAAMARFSRIWEDARAQKVFRMRGTGVGGPPFPILPAQSPASPCRVMITTSETRGPAGPVSPSSRLHRDHFQEMTESPCLPEPPTVSTPPSWELSPARPCSAV